MNNIQIQEIANQATECLQECNTPLIPISHICSQTSLDSQNNFSDSYQNQQNQIGSSDENQSHITKGNKTQTDIESFQELILKNIKSKQQIEIQSKQNQQILRSLNSNIDDLFKKISQLTDEITTQSPASMAFNIKQKQKQKTTSLTQIQLVEDSQQDIQLAKQNINGLYNSSTIIPTKVIGNFCSKISGKTKQTKYKSIFFSNNQSNFKQSSVNMKLFQTGRSLGCGKFGEVLQCRQNKTFTLYALKKIFKSAIKEYEMEEQILTEIKILSMIDHPNIIKAYESFTDEFHIFILMQYVQGKSLVTKFKSSENQVKILVKQVLQALHYLHEKKIAHRDIKPQNIIITQNNIVKICDFGWSSTNSDQMNIICGTLDYVCPQMVSNEPYTLRVDLWNVGILTYELLFGVPPFKSSSKAKTFQRVKDMEYTFPQDIPISQPCKQFIVGFLQREDSRKSLEWGLSHPFLIVNPSQGQTSSYQADQILKDTNISSQFQIQTRNLLLFKRDDPSIQGSLFMLGQN